MAVTTAHPAVSPLLVVKGDLSVPNQWKTYYDENHRRLVVVSCPECARQINLSEHIIYDNGEVSPTVRCLGGCEQRFPLHLLNWMPDR